MGSIVGGSIGFRPVLLWENEEPKDSSGLFVFTNKTITNDNISNYDWFILKYWTRSQWQIPSGYRTTILSRTAGDVSAITDAIHVFLYRYYTIEGNTITFTNASATTVYNGNNYSSDEAGAIVPIEIYGIK